MDPQKIYDSILEEWLPTKWSRWIGGLTPSLATGGIFLPNFLQKIDIHPTSEQTLLIRLSLPPTILFLGSFIILLIVVHHYKFLKNSISIKTEQKIILTEIHEKVLTLLFKKPSTVENIYKILKITKEEANYYLYDLYDKNMVETPTPYSPGPEEWRISQDGRKNIINKQNAT